MNTYESMTAAEMKRHMEALGGVFTVVRLLSPRDGGMAAPNGEGEGLCASADEVFVQKGTHVCGTCIARAALREKSRRVKLECIGGAMYQVIARYVEVDGEGRVLELINRLDDDGQDRMVEKLLRRYDEVNRDVLSGAYNRRFYEEQMRRTRLEAGVAMIDLDDFKLYNDIYGHAMGDAVIAAVAGAMQAEIRRTDKLIRYGGDEFLLVMPGVSEKNWEEALHRICRAVRAVRLAGCDGERFSVSIGGTLCRGEPVEEAVSRADAMMYRAKEKKDAVVTGQGTAGPVKTRKKPLVLVADDTPDDREQLRECLSEEFSVLTADGGDACIRALEQYGTAVSLVLLDLIMPTPDGFDVLEYMAEHRLLEDIPVIIVTGDENDALLGSAYEMGVTDYLNRPFDAHTVRRRVRNTVRLYAKQRRLLSMVSTQLTARDKNARFLVDLLAEVEGYRCGTDGRTHARIAAVTRLLLDHLSAKDSRYHFDGGDVNLICSASLLHDIGKIGVMRKILQKPAALDAAETERIREHPVIGANLIARLTAYRDEPFYRLCYQVCRWHHERWDGGGYPDGLRGDEIPMAAQVVSLADAYDALISDRPYRPAYTPDEAFAIIGRGECGAFNPVLLDAMHAARPALRALAAAPVGGVL